MENKVTFRAQASFWLAIAGNIAAFALLGGLNKGGALGALSLIFLQIYATVWLFSNEHDWKGKLTTVVVFVILFGWCYILAMVL
jgi:hypothetical protein